MAYANTHFADTNVRQKLTRPFTAISSFMGLFSESLSMAHDAHRVANMSDAALKAKGITRAEAIETVFS